MPKPPHKHVSPFGGIRFLASAWVLADHIYDYFWNAFCGLDADSSSFNAALASKGWQGVFYASRQPRPFTSLDRSRTRRS